MTTPSYVVMFRGKPACPCLAAWLPVYEGELLRRGLIKHQIDIYQLIGGAAASAGTHSSGGAYDLAQFTDEAIVVSREMGGISWHRPLNWDGKGGIEHQHGVLMDCPHNGPARYQIDAYKAGFNGLGLNGRGGRDTGPRGIHYRTWREGIDWAKTQAGHKSTAPAFPNFYAAGQALARAKAAHRPGDPEYVAAEAALEAIAKFNR